MSSSDDGGETAAALRMANQHRGLIFVDDLDLVKRRSEEVRSRSVRLRVIPHHR